MSKPAMVLLHGAGSNSAMWIGDFAEYSNHYHVYAIDVIGECGKSASARPKFVDGHYAEWLNEVFMFLKIEEAIILGCSLGGWIGLDFVISFPKKVDRLVLISTAGITPIKLKAVLLIMLSSMFGEWGFNRINKMVYGKLEIDELALEFALLVKEHFLPRTDVLPVFRDEELKGIGCPLMFIGGENDCFYNSGKTGLRLSRLVKNSSIEFLEDTGHVVLGQTKKIIEFLKEYYCVDEE